MEIRQALRKALADITAGSIFIAFGLAFAITAATYEVGDAFRMGPGYFPLLLGGVLVLLGALIVISGFVAEREQGMPAVPWRAVLLLTGALVFFGFAVRGLGLVPALFVAVLMSAFSSARIGVLIALAIAFGLTVLSVVIFVVALQLRLPLFGPWLRF